MHVTLRAEIATIFGPNVVRQFPHAIQKYTKFENFASHIASKLCNFTHSGTLMPGYQFVYLAKIDKKS